MNKNRIKDLREDSDLYQEDIAKVIKVTQQNYSLWEIGTKIIPLKHLNTLCNYYKVSMDYILGFSNDRSYPNERFLNKLDNTLVGNNIEIIRKEYNLTYRSLAKILNTTPSTVHAYKTGKTLILTAFAIELCKKYNLSMDWLCGRSDIKYTKEKVRN